MTEAQKHAQGASVGAPSLSLRDRKKDQVRAALGQAALRLFAERGFDGVTVDEIAAEAFVSRRTFFRYFSAKEAAVFARREAQLEALRERLARPGKDAPFAAVRAALLELARDYVENREQILAEQAVIRKHPSLLSHDLEIDRGVEEIIASHLARGGRRSAAERRRARMLAAAIVGVVRVAIDEWSERSGQIDLRKLGEEALSLLEPLSSAST